MTRTTVATVASLVLLVVALATIQPDLPDPVATHFGPDGVANGFSGRAGLWATTLGLTAVLAIPIAVLTATIRQNLPTSLRWIRGLPVGLVWAIGGIQVATLLPQRGLDDATTATVPDWGIVVALGLGVVATVLASRLVPEVDPPPVVDAAPSDLPRAALADDTTALWRGATPTARIGGWLSAIIAAAALAAGILFAWWLAALLLAVAVLLLASARFDVTIGPAAVRVSGWLGGWPRLEVPLDTVTAARASTMRAFEYGGLGLRLAVGQPITAVVTASGPALDLSRSDDSTVRINLDDAEEAVAVVNALLDRRALGRDAGT